MENKNGKAVLISPAKHSLTFNGARNTKFGVTNMTLEQFNAISRIDDTPLKNLSPTTESIEIENGKDMHTRRKMDKKEWYIFKT